MQSLLNHTHNNQLWYLNSQTWVSQPPVFAKHQNVLGNKLVDNELFSIMMMSFLTLGH